VKSFARSQRDIRIENIKGAVRRMGSPSPGLLPAVEPATLPPALRGGPFTLIDTEIGDFWAPTGDEVMRPYLQRHRAWDESRCALLARLLRPGARFLDVGAALGYMSVFAARVSPGVTVDSIEPHPDTLALLRFNLWLNGVPARVWPVALDAQRQSLILSCSVTNLGDARVSAHDPSTQPSIVVPAVPADELFPRRGFDVVKIDVQGWELEVVLGMRRILSQSRNIAVVAEFWPSALRGRGEDPLAVLAAYRSLGFDIVLARSGSLETIPDRQILGMCDSAGENGQVNLLLRHA
jgi:FkbM family methyltransferase